MASPRVSIQQPSLTPLSFEKCIIINANEISNIFFSKSQLASIDLSCVIMVLTLLKRVILLFALLGFVFHREWSKIITRHILIQIKADEIVATFSSFLANSASCFLKCDVSRQLLSLKFAALN